MGGFGSGNRYHWHRPSKKVTTSSCLQLSISCLLRKGLLIVGEKRDGYIGWKLQDSRKKKTVQCSVDATNMKNPRVHISYQFKIKKCQPSVEVAISIDLSTTRLANGGLRWWFLCPSNTLLDLPCRRRVGKLFLPVTSIYFKCRNCHRLTYDSCQNSRRFDSLAAYMGRHEDTEQVASIKAILKLTQGANSEWFTD